MASSWFVKSWFVSVLFWFGFNALFAQGQGCETCLYATINSTTDTGVVLYAVWSDNGQAAADTLSWMPEDTLTAACGEGVEWIPGSTLAVSATGDTLAVSMWALTEALVVDTVTQQTDNPDLVGVIDTVYTGGCHANQVIYYYKPPNTDFVCDEIISYRGDDRYRHEMDFPLGSGKVVVDFVAYGILDTLIILAAGEVVFEEAIGTNNGATLPDDVVWDNGVVTPFNGDSPIHGRGFVRVILDLEDNCDLKIIAQSNYNRGTYWRLYVHCCPNCYEPPPILATVDTALCFFGSVKGVPISRDTSFSRFDFTAGGCDSITVFNVHVAKPTIEAILTDSASCYGFQDGAARAVVNAESPSFMWSNGSIQQEAQGLSAGVHALTLTDQYGCMATASSAVHQPPELGGGIEGVEPNCYGEQNGRLTLMPYGGSPSYSFNWSSGHSSISVDSLATGEYTVTITDSHGCETPVTYFLDQPDSLIAEMLFLKPTCVGIHDGEVAADVVGGTMPYGYLWEDGSDATWRYDLGTGMYQVTVTDSHGCVDTARKIVRSEFANQAYVPNAFSPNNDGVNDTFYPHPGRCVAKVLKFAVYDRWGELLFEEFNFQPNDKTKAWDGSFRGQLLTPDTYIWYLEVEYFSGQQEVLKGDVAILK